jgi:hypothetical protein
MYGPPGVGHHPVQATSLPRSDCSDDSTLTGPPLASWLAAPVASAPPAPDRELVGTTGEH